jgi:hypothetical protein
MFNEEKGALTIVESLGCYPTTFTDGIIEYNPD